MSDEFVDPKRLVFPGLAGLYHAWDIEIGRTDLGVG